MKSKGTRGLSLAETLVAILLMAMTLWSIQWLYVRLLGGTNKSEARRAAVAEAEDLLAIWSQRVIDIWPAGPGAVNPVPPESYAVEDYHNEYIYRVDVSGRLLNPFRNEAAALVKAPVIDMQKISVTVYYADKSATVASKSLYVKLVGSVSN